MTIPVVFPPSEWRKVEDGLPEWKGKPQWATLHWVLMWMDAHDASPGTYWAHFRDDKWWVDGMYGPWDATDQVTAYAPYHPPEPPNWQATPWQRAWQPGADVGSLWWLRIANGTPDGELSGPCRYEGVQDDPEFPAHYWRLGDDVFVIEYDVIAYAPYCTPNPPRWE